MMTIHKRNGTIKIYRSEALQIQLPPDNSIDALRTNVKAKKKDAQIPIIIDFNLTHHDSFYCKIDSLELGCFI
jgi:uncharacterized protein (UPF0303 family)